MDDEPAGGEGVERGRTGMSLERTVSLNCKRLVGVVGETTTSSTVVGVLGDDFVSR